MNQIGIILMAVYRPSPDLLERQLASLRYQSCRDWSCVVGIDGSDPVTASLLLRMVGEDPRFVVHEFAENVGHYRNFARLAQSCVSQQPAWVAFADQDDYWYPHKLKYLLSVLDRGASGVTGQARVVRRGKTLGRTSRRRVPIGALLCNNQVTGSASVFRGAVLSAACPLPEPRAASYHDHWFGVVSAALGRHEFVPDVVQDYVQHDANVLGEELGTRVLQRVRDLVGVLSGPKEVARTLTYERWGWRVVMAREVGVRIPLSAADASVTAIARGRISFRLIVLVSGAIIRGEVPALRGLALLVGSALNPASRRAGRRFP